MGLSVQAEQPQWQNQLGVVVIGRNEGERLMRCLASLKPSSGAVPVVYVDSGSTDGSAGAAAQAGACVVALDLSKPFTAARARNEGLATLLARWPDLSFVQFVDGDCEVHPAWLGQAAKHLQSRPRTAAVCGRLRERFPGASIYNRLCDAEWNRPPGITSACGGIVMMRISALAQCGSFNPGIVAGEEPELCARLRTAGHEVWRLDQDMALHDAAMFRFGQWWQRSRRGGFATALLANTAGFADAAERQRHNRGIVVWALGIPLCALILGVVAGPALGVATLLLYPLQVLRIARHETHQGSWRWLVAAFTVLGKFPMLMGMWQFHRSARRGTQAAQRFDYKPPA